MCKSCAANKKCQTCIRVTLVILFIIVVVQIILAILKGVFTKQLITAEIMQEILKLAGTDPSKIADIEGVFTLIGAVFAIVTVFGILWLLFLFCSVKFCPHTCCPKFLVFMTWVLSIVIMIIFFIIGGALTVVGSGFSEEKLTEACDKLARNDTSYKLELGVTDVSVSEQWSEVKAMDDLFVQNINKYMCSDLCVCPGTPADDWVKAYRAVPEETLNKYDRTQGLTGATKFDGSIDITRMVTDGYKPLIFAYDPLTEQESPTLVSFTSDSFISCVENQETFIAQYKQQQLAEVQAQYPNNPDVAAQLAQQKSDQYTSTQKSSVKLSKEQKGFIDFLEREYKCSGMCTKSLFYISQPVQAGLPEKGCLPAMGGAIADLIFNLGRAMVATAVFFLFIGLLVCSVCCYKKENLDAVKSFEGGNKVDAANEVEMAEKVDDSCEQNLKNKDQREPQAETIDV